MTVRRGFLYTGVFLLVGRGRDPPGPGRRHRHGGRDPGRVALAAGGDRDRRRADPPPHAGRRPGGLDGRRDARAAGRRPDRGDARPAGPRGLVGALRRGEPGRRAATERQGAFGDAASVDLSLACGELVVTTGPGNAWQFAGSDGHGAGAVVTDSADRLSIRSVDRQRSLAALARGDTWRLRLPTGTALDLAAAISAGKATLDLAGARLGALRLDVNAGDASLDLDGATVSSPLAHRQRGQGHGAAAGHRRPHREPGRQRGLARRLRAGRSRAAGPGRLVARRHHLQRARPRRLTPGRARTYATARFHADVTVSANVGSVVLNPKGGCL